MIVEDQQDDVLLAKRAFAKVLPGVALDFVPDGEAAIAFLRRLQGENKEGLGAIRVLLDLKLPKKSGLEVLAWIRGNPETRSLPVVVLTTSSEVSDVQQAESLGIDRYCVKPLAFQEFLDIVRHIGATWRLLDPE